MNSELGTSYKLAPAGGKMLKRYYKKNGKLPAGNTCFH